MMSYSLHPNFILITVVLRIIILRIKNNLSNYFDTIITTNNKDAQVKQRCSPKRVRSDSAKDNLDIKKVSPHRRGLCFVHLVFWAKLAFIKYLLNKR